LIEVRPKVAARRVSGMRSREGRVKSDPDIRALRERIAGRTSGVQIE